jgi:hypothetical protein
MRIPPKTPNAGSIRVSREIGLGLGEADADADTELENDWEAEEPDNELARDGVTVTMNAVWIREVLGTWVLPERTSVIEVIVLVVRVVKGAEAPPESVFDWADTSRPQDKTAKRKVMT